jgi:PhnB protein
MPRIPPPPGHHSLTPACVVPNAAQVITFLEKAFGGEIVDRYEGPGGTVFHAEVMIAGSVLMLGEAGPEMPAMPIAISHYVADGDAVDAAYDRALDAGAVALMAPANQFYGYRSATVKDVGGNRWTICAVIEQLSHDEMQRRMTNMMKGG